MEEYPRSGSFARLQLGEHLPLEHLSETCESKHRHPTIRLCAQCSCNNLRLPWRIQADAKPAGAYPTLTPVRSWICCLTRAGQAQTFTQEMLKS